MGVDVVVGGWRSGSLSGHWMMGGGGHGGEVGELLEEGDCGDGGGHGGEAGEVLEEGDCGDGGGDGGDVGHWGLLVVPVGVAIKK